LIIKAIGGFGSARDPDTLALIELDPAFPVGSRADSFLLVLPEGLAIPLDSIIP